MQGGCVRFKFGDFGFAYGAFPVVFFVDVRPSLPRKRNCILWIRNRHRAWGRTGNNRRTRSTRNQESCGSIKMKSEVRTRGSFQHSNMRIKATRSRGSNTRHPIARFKDVAASAMHADQNGSAHRPVDMPGSGRPRQTVTIGRAYRRRTQGGALLSQQGSKAAYRRAATVARSLRQRPLSGPPDRFRTCPPAIRNRLAVCLAPNQGLAVRIPQRRVVFPV